MLETKYNHQQVEEGKYKNWKEKKYFNAGDTSKEAFSIVMPPPNVTGKLHLGHALNGSIQDTIIRYKRMQGFDALWLPGMDHAAIATEAKVVARLKEQGINKYELGREGFLKECWNWTNEYSENIRNQWSKLGLSVDYTKERFTLDEGLNKAVTETFINYYNEGLIYRGERIINWDPIAKTALSNEEVIYKEVNGSFYNLKYKIENSDEFLTVATTRPETLFGDTAVAVNPEDVRYKHLIGKNVILPIINKLIPIIADEHADPEFGTGVVKITPAHDPNDFEVGNRHNLDRVVIMNEDATMNELTGPYNKLTREECRKQLLKDLEDKDLLISIKNMTHSVGHSERTGCVVEPYLSKQWFVKMGDLASDVLKMQSNKETKINFIPERFEKTLNHWMEISYDWCISRQLWWGHRIPAWYKDEEIKIQAESPGDGWVQDNDVLDTWFSSALWPMSTLGWPNNTEDYERYFPTDVLVTAYDIIFFWVARMAFQAKHITGKRPFKDCLIHGLIRASDGSKMSKSLGNGIDPMDLISDYGTDSLRYYLTTSIAAGTDLRFDKEKVASTWNFINKLWNASRFVLLNIEDKEYQMTNLNDADKWILTKLNKTIKSVTKHMDKYEFNLAGTELYSFIWTNYCDSYIEMSKFSNTDSTKAVLLHVLESILKMMHPFMPFVTEEIYQLLPKHNESIMISDYPKYNKKYIYEEESSIDIMLNLITQFRNKKAENNIGADFEITTNYNNELFNKMVKITDKIITTSDLNSITVSINEIKINIHYDNSANEAETKALLQSELENLEQSISRREKLLSNENYVAKAPEKIVTSEREKLIEEKTRVEVIKDLLK